MKKIKKISLLIIIAILVCIVTLITINTRGNEIRTIKSEKQLYKLSRDTEENEILKLILGMPYSILSYGLSSTGYAKNASMSIDNGMGDAQIVYSTTPSSINLEGTSGSEKSTNTKDFSKTNIQVENVDEADINKTDGDYIYSISETNVIITDVRNPNEISIASKIESDSSKVPEEMILADNKLVVIYTKFNSVNTRYYSYYSKNNTAVEIYDITDKSNPNLIKSYELYEPYYTSRCIDNKLYVISSGSLRVEDNKVERKYREDYEEKEIPLNKINYLKDVDSTMQSQISYINLNDINSSVSINSYLMDISNAYVSEKGIYLLDSKYEYDDEMPLKTLFGFKGALGPFFYMYNYDYSSEKNTEIYKFDIQENGQVKYNSKNKIKGQTINQYSLDEKEGHLRVALYDDDGARIVVFDEKLNQIGESEKVAKGEKMYSSRFIGDKAYMVTYRTVDPLFVIDLSDEEKPKVLGELKIPGYSTYLHPYDENHLIGIGMETEEIINRNSLGKVTSTTARITGMKMALFDVSNVNKPKQISDTIIGDSRTTSAILTNPKALLFSKEKNLIAIPINNYEDEFDVETSVDDYETTINAYKNYNKNYIAEGYLVYHIDLENGFDLKGVITHEKARNTGYYSYYTTSKLLRGLYIDNNLFTISETAIKVNNLETLELVNEMKIENSRGNKNGKY